MVDKSKGYLGGMFSIELESKDCLKQVDISSNPKGKVLVEGFLGEIEKVGFVEGVLLEIRGTNGTLKMDLEEEDLRKMLKIGKSCEKVQ
jgi:hypothetical protein